MKNRRIYLLALAGLLLGMFSGIIGPWPASDFLNGKNVQSAAAAPKTDFTVYIPIAMFHSPLQTVFGVEMWQITQYGFLDKVTQAKTTWVRRNALLWSSIEPTEGVYDWSSVSSLEQEMINASQSGLDLILIVRSTPAWAQKVAGYSCGPVSSAKLQAFGNFMYEAVKRYSVAPYNVRYWQIWNEPDYLPQYVAPDNLFGCWGDKNDSYYGGGYYADALKAVYPRIKQANPRAQVLVGGLMLGCQVCSDGQQKFLEGILRHQDGNGNFDGKNYFDGVAFHAYDAYVGSLGSYNNTPWNSTWKTTGPVTIAKARFVKSVLNTYNASDKFLMNTEVALTCIPAPGEQTCPPDANFDTTKAYYAAQAYAAAIAEGLKASIWYDISGAWRNSGLLYPDPNNSPAYTAFQVARNAFSDATFTSEITAYAGVKGYEFNRGTRRVWILWSLDGSDHAITLPGTPLAAYDVFNNPITINGADLTVKLAPTYLEWNP